MAKYIIHKHNTSAPFTLADLQNLGKGQIAYVRQFRMKEQPVYVLYAADGSAIGVQKDTIAAKNAALEQDLEIVRLH